MMYSGSHLALLSLNRSVSQGKKPRDHIVKFLWILNGKNYSLLVFPPRVLRSPPPEHRALLFERLEQARFSDSSLCTEELKFRIPWAVFRIPQTKISRIPESRFPYIGWKIWRLFNHYSSIPNGLWLIGHKGERNNCFRKIQLVGQKYRALKKFSFLKLVFNPFSAKKPTLFATSGL